MAERLLTVALDENGTILEFECDLLDVISYPKGAVTGKNWFELFIATADLENVMKTFKLAFHAKTPGWERHTNDIRCKDGSHRLVDFENRFETRNGKRVLVSVGRDHFLNQQNAG
jgi:PAS domain S-box-containing protein